MTEQERTPEDVYKDFWKFIIETPDGRIDMEQLMSELSDYYELIRTVQKVYPHITGDKLKATTYDADTICNSADEYYEKHFYNHYVDKESK
jgi:hypothetical protein